MAQKKNTLRQKGTKSKENMFRSFMEIFFISVQQILQGVVPDGADKGVGVVGTSCVEVEGQAVNNFVDRRAA
jgi:hypothetical protein